VEVVPFPIWFPFEASMYHQTSELFMRKAQIVKWGKGLAVRIPKAVAEQARLQEGDAVSIEVLNGRVELRLAEGIPTLEELVAQITPENRHGEIDWGPDVGKEMW
jgi:antitoxin MazE